MKQHSKLSQEKQQEQEVNPLVQHQAGQEFAGPEELLRFDASHTEVPLDIASRLKKSTGAATPARPWWKNLFGK